MLDASGLIVWITDGAAATGPIARLLARHARADVSHAAVGRQCGRRCLPNRVDRDPSCPAGRTQGAIVAPILTANGCMGALSAEIKDGGEGSEAVQAIAAIVAAHLASVVAAAPAEAAAPEQPQQPKLLTPN